MTLEEKKAYNKQYRETHKTEAAQWKKDNAEKIKAYGKAYHNEHYIHHPIPLLSSEQLILNKKTTDKKSFSKYRKNNLKKEAIRHKEYSNRTAGENDGKKYTSDELRLLADRSLTATELSTILKRKVTSIITMRSKNFSKA